ncbi:MAG: hypothetical protein RLZZ399_2608 [Verrucomicrobiota bacterium]|jgi:hypothetical protein
MESFFRELGQRVLERWNAANFSPTLFPEIAFHALKENPPADHVDASELIREFLLEDRFPAQSQSGFGQPELIVYDHPRFYIQILFWMDGTTDIHQHTFSGAFHVMQGSSIHSQFAFHNRHPVSAHLHLGDLSLTSTALLETGHTERILSGPGFIHALFHLETPSITVVLRTHTDPGSGPQFTYLPPHVALDPLLSDSLTQRRKELLDVLESLQEPSYASLVCEMLAKLDFERGFFILQNGKAALHHQEAWQDALDVFTQKHGRLAAGVPATLEEIVRRDALVALRRQIEDVDHRFFLALLLNVPTRDALLGLVEQKTGGDPIPVVMQWAEELLDYAETGASILGFSFPEGLEPPLEEQAVLLLETLRYFLEEGRDSRRSISLRSKPAICAGDLNGWRLALARSGLRPLAR